MKLFDGQVSTYGYLTAVIDVIHCRGKDNHCRHAPIGGVRRCNKAKVNTPEANKGSEEGHPARRRLWTTWHRVPPLLVRRTRCTDTSALSACFPSQIACRFLAASSIEAGLSVPRAAFPKQVPPRYLVNLIYWHVCRGPQHHTHSNPTIYTRGNIYDDHPSHITHRPTTNYPAPAWRPRVGYKKDDNFSQAYLRPRKSDETYNLYPYLRATTPKLAVASRRHPYPTNNTGGEGEGGHERVNGDRTATSIRVPRLRKCQRKRQKELQPRVQMQIKTR